MATKNFLGNLISANRKARGLLQQEVADRIGMTRSLYSQLETGHRKEPLTPLQARAVSAFLGIPMLSLVNAMGYPVECPELQDAWEVALVEGYRRQDAETKRFLLRGLGIESDPAPATGSPAG